MNQAAEQNARPNEFFPNSTVVPFSPQTESGLQGTEARATDPTRTATLDMAEAENQRTTSGSYLDAGNPYFQSMMDRVQNQIQPRVDSAFAGGGRYGSAGHKEAMGRAFGDAGANLAFTNFDAERGRMGEAVRAAPGIYGAGFAPMEALQKTGAARESMGGAQLGEDIARWDHAQNDDRNRLQQFMSLIGGGTQAAGSGKTVNEPTFASNPWVSGLGMASTAASIFNAFQ